MEELFTTGGAAHYHHELMKMGSSNASSRGGLAIILSALSSSVPGRRGRGSGSKEIVVYLPSSILFRDPMVGARLATI
jgi:hypothetical protein